ncbi:MAG: ATP-grasp domain-containing protein [Candidatus Baldrarchaeia archaeon]
MVFFEFEARKMCKQAGLRSSALIKVSRILQRLYDIFNEYDALIAEINPLAMTKDGNFYAVDAKIEIDDDALFRHQDLAIKPESRVESEAKAEAIRIGLSYVELDGDIGVICSGAGLAMATIDLIKDFGGKPANFLETGGGINEQLMFDAVKLVSQHRQLKALFINLYGGINPMVPAAKGIVKAYKEFNIQIPILVKLVGNKQEKAWEILENADIPVFKGIKTEEAVKKLMKLVGEC